MTNAVRPDCTPVADDFWTEARRALSAVRPDLFMLAEAEGPQYHAAFNATYGWELHHLSNEIAQGMIPAHGYRVLVAPVV